MKRGNEMESKPTRVFFFNKMAASSHRVIFMGGEVLKKISIF